MFAVDTLRQLLILQNGALVNEKCFAVFQIQWAGTLFGRYHNNPFLLTNIIHLFAKSKHAEELTPLGDFPDWSIANCCTLYPIKWSVSPIWYHHQIFHLCCFFWCKFSLSCYISSSLMSKCPIAIKKQKWIFFITILKISLSEISEFIFLTAKSGWTANKDASQNLNSSGNTEQNLHVYQKFNSMTKNSQANFVSGYLLLIQVCLLSIRSLMLKNDACV